MQTLTEFLASLPGVMPLKARREILDGDLLPDDLKSDIVARSDSLFDTVLVVGPDAAAAILAAYKQGRLPMRRGEKARATPRAEAYVADADALRTELAERKRKRDAVKDPSLVRESDFMDVSFLDRVFFTQIGPGSGTVILASIAVTKTATEYKTNSGKNSAWGVRFQWTGSDGRPRSSERTPPQANNRRNDASRNYGLPE